jgi:hypothetical protein
VDERLAYGLEEDRLGEPPAERLDLRPAPVLESHQGEEEPANMKSRTLQGVVLLLAMALLGCSTSGREKAEEGLRKAATEEPTWQRMPSTNQPRDHVVVQFSDATLHPSIARVTKGGQVTWVNYSSSYTGAVVFPDSFAEALTCGKPRPEFGKVAGGYQSEPITGEMGEDVHLPCPLAPGEYEYEIFLFEGRLMDRGASMFDPNSTLQGKIVAE